MNDLEKLEFHCPITSCNQIDFLPFQCKYCFTKFCSNHRSPDSHNCMKIQKSLNLINENPKIKPKISINCAKCNIKLTPINEFECKKCGKLVCLKHRYEESHDCVNNGREIKFDINTNQNQINKNPINQPNKNLEKKKKNSRFACFWMCCKSKKPKK